MSLINSPPSFHKEQEILADPILQLFNSPSLSSMWTWLRVLLPSVQELWLGWSVWPMAMPVDDAVSVVLNWCHQRAWDALLNQ